MLEIKNIDAQIEKVLQHPDVRADYASHKCCGRMQVPVGNKLFPQVSPAIVVDAESDLYHIDFSFSELSQNAEIANEEYYDDAVECVNTLIDKGIVMSLHEISKGGIITTLLEMNFPNSTGGMKINFKEMGNNRVEDILFASNPGVIVQVASKDKDKFLKVMKESETYFAKIGYPCDSRWMSIRKNSFVEDYDIDALRKHWCEGFREEPLMLSLGYTFKGVMPCEAKTSFVAAVQEKNESITLALEAAGFEVTELDSDGNGLDNAHLIIYSNLDEEKVKAFMSRGKTLAIQVMNAANNAPMRFQGMQIEENDNVMLTTLSRRKLAIWTDASAKVNAEGVATFMYDKGTAAQSTYEGRHLSLRGVLCESIFPKQWGWYPENRNDQVSPWIELFANAKTWIANC
ncbi:MAG: AIR synthase-related protein [Prevotellaceae bacterium]|nr:AIR synthase-related protein [Prevotellaceae bacterium]